MLLNQVICGDSLEVMRTLPDNSIDLVLTDPPYGLQWKSSTLFGKSTPQTKALKDLQQWDKRPRKEYFDEIRRIGKEWIIWGGNYFADYLGPCREPLLWDKQTGANNYADGELAFTSFQGTLRIFHHQWCGAFKDSERGVQNQHPTQKPVELMRWCLDKYSDEGHTILDPF
jgi:site-specific DNA-methyltransferase (adenine-specific)